MGQLASASLNYQLTAFAQGFMNDLAGVLELAERLAPTVPVPGASGQYKQFNDANSFKVYATERALGGDANRIRFAASDAYYNTKPQALEVTVDDAEREQAGGDGGGLASQLLDEGKVKALLNSTALAHGKKVVDYVIANTSAVADRGNWSSDAVDPIDQLDEQLDELCKGVGSTQFIHLTMDVTAWRTIRNHPKVKARVTGSQATPLTRQQLVDSLCIPVNFGVYGITFDEAALGQSTSSKKRLLNADVLIHYAVPSPTQYDPSAFKVFTMNRSRVTAVRTYRGAGDRYDVHAVDWSEDVKQTSTSAIRRLRIS